MKASKLEEAQAPDVLTSDRQARELLTGTGGPHAHVSISFLPHFQKDLKQGPQEPGRQEGLTASIRFWNITERRTDVYCTFLTQGPLELHLKLNMEQVKAR